MRALVLMPFLLACGSTPAFVRVDAAHYALVPAEERQQVEERASPELARAQQEQQRADQALQATGKELDETRAEKKQVADKRGRARAELARAKTSGNPDDLMRAELGVKEADEGEKVHAAKLRWLEKIVVVRREERAVASWRRQAAEAELELAKAEVVAQHMPGDQPYDVMRFRNQHGRMRKDLGDATRRLGEARAQAEPSQRELVQAKARYAEIQKTALPPPELPPEPPPPEPLPRASKPRTK